MLAVAIATNVGMLVMYVREQDDSSWYNACALIGKGAALAGIYVIQILTAELYPTCVRYAYFEAIPHPSPNFWSKTKANGKQINTKSNYQY